MTVLNICLIQAIEMVVEYVKSQLLILALRKKRKCELRKLSIFGFWNALEDVLYFEGGA